MRERLLTAGFRQILGVTFLAFGAEAIVRALVPLLVLALRFVESLSHANTRVSFGWLGDRYGARMLMLGASILIGTGTVLLGTITELWHFYLFYGFFVGSLGHAAFSVLLPVIMTRWFARNMGVALGIYWAALGAGPMIFAPLFRWLIETRGWEQTFTIVGAGLGVILLLFSALIVGSPREKGVSAYGAPVDGSAATAKSTPAKSHGSLREILRLLQLFGRQCALQAGGTLGGDLAAMMSDWVRGVTA